MRLLRPVREDQEGEPLQLHAAPQHEVRRAQEVLEGRCLECAVRFKGRLLDYDFGRRILWAKFRRRTVLEVMES